MDYITYLSIEIIEYGGADHIEPTGVVSRRKHLRHCYHRLLRQIGFEVVAECSRTRARAGLLHTAHGVIETPVFMPVGTQATVKGLTARDLAEDLGVRILLANTYHLYLRPGAEAIREPGRAAPLHGRGRTPFSPIRAASRCSA